MEPVTTAVLSDGTAYVIDVAATSRLGRLSLLDQQTAQATFTLRNATTRPLHITRLVPSCGCVSSTTQPLPFDIAPCGSATVTVTLDLTRLPIGPFIKSVFLYTNASPSATSPGTPSDSPASTLSLSGILVPALSFLPATVEIGAMDASGTATRQVTVLYDPRVTPSGAPLELASAALDVTVTPLGSAESDPALGGLRRRFQVTVRAAAAGDDLPAGAFDAAITPTPPAPSAATPTAATAAVTRALANARLLVHAQIQGDIAATPPSLAGSGIPGHPFAAGFDVTATPHNATTAEPPATLLKGITVLTTGALWLRASLRLAPDGASVHVTLTLAPDTPAGLHSTRVDLITARGHHLIVPIEAYIAPRY
jgi:hypothetical protein